MVNECYHHTYMRVIESTVWSWLDKIKYIILVLIGLGVVLFGVFTPRGGFKSTADGLGVNQSGKVRAEVPASSCTGGDGTGTDTGDSGWQGSDACAACEGCASDTGDNCNSCGSCNGCSGGCGCGS